MAHQIGMSDNPVGVGVGVEKNKTPPRKSFANVSMFFWQTSCCVIMNGRCTGY
jgi:hypothetical protein